jgi:hypothetical protein
MGDIGEGGMMFFVFADPGNPFLINSVYWILIMTNSENEVTCISTNPLPRYYKRSSPEPCTKLNRA